MVGLVPTQDVPEGTVLQQGLLAQGFSLQLRPGERALAVPIAGSIPLFNDKREPQADIAFTAYQLNGADARTGERYRLAGGVLTLID